MIVISALGRMSPQDLRFEIHIGLSGPSTPLTDARVPAAPGLGTEHAGEENTQLAVDQCHIPAPEDLQGGEAEMEA